MSERIEAGCDVSPWLSLVIDRFGIPPDVFAGFAFERPSSKYITVRSRTARQFAEVQLLDSGFVFMKTSATHTKLSTEAAMAFGHAGTRNVVDVSRRVAEAFVRREAFVVTGDETARCTGAGHVLVRHDGIGLGIGYFVPTADGGEVRSLFPKVWSGVRRLP
jgi:NOL1/NOP2/fmu family ribosome biogenesis protein